ncbi:uncharacterized protein LOC135222739 [Macrobrachium nipponense]|uniref:uncharacterized protein LOC135222739 n=1 Tax=Macrobrachium nipponense TaxID=159736 RepID=UPI0030C8A733
MWLDLSSSSFRHEGLLSLVLLVSLRRTEGASIPGREGHCKVYHLTDNDTGSSSTPLVPLSKSTVVYFYSDSPFWSHFSIRFANRFDETSGMLSYQMRAEGEQDASGTFTLTGLQDAEDGDGSAKKYKEEVVKIPEDVFHLHRNVWINLTMGVVDSKLKLFFADYATIHFTINAAFFNKVSVHSEEGQAISVTFDCMDSQNGTGATHSNSNTGLIIGLTLLILAGLLITAAIYIFRKRRNGLLESYILRKGRNRQQLSSSEETQEQMGEHSKINIHNNPFESQSECETGQLLKPEGERDIEYSTKNEVELDKAISEVTKNDDEMAPTLKYPKKADQNSKQTNENLVMTDGHLKENENSCQAHSPLVISIPNPEDGKTILNKDSALPSQGEDALQRELRSNQSGENCTVPLSKVSSISDEAGVQKSYQEEALQQEASANQGNKIIGVQSKSKEMHNYAISDLQHTPMPDIVKNTTMQCNCSLLNASERATNGADDEGNNYISEHQVRYGLTEKQQNGKEHTNETLNSTTMCQTAHSTYMETDIRSIAKISSEEEQGNLPERSKSSVGQEMEDFGAMVPNFPNSREIPKHESQENQAEKEQKQESQENQAEKEQCQEKTDAESKSSTEISHSKDMKATNANEILTVSTRAPSKEDTFNRKEMTKRESTKTKKKNKGKKTPKTSNTPQTHSPENHPADVVNESIHLNKPVQDISQSVTKNREDTRQITHTTPEDYHKKQVSYKTEPQSVVCSSVAPLQFGKPEENQNLYETPTTSLKIMSKTLVPTQADQVSPSIKSRPESTAAKINEFNDIPQVNQEGNLLVSDQALLSQADMKPQNVQILPIHSANKDTYHTNIHQLLENVRPRTEDNKRTEGLHTASNEQTDSEPGNSVINMSSHNGIQENNLGSNERNEKQVQCNNNYSHDGTNQQLPYIYSTLSIPTEEARGFTQIQKITANCISANMTSDTYPQVQHLHRANMELESPTEHSKVEEFIHTPSNCLHFHRHLHKILLQSLNTPGCQGDFEIKLGKELEFKLTNLNQPFPHKSSKWKITHFHRDVRKQLVRNPPHRATRGDLLHVFRHKEMRKSKENRVRYRLHLKKCGCQLSVTSSRKKKIRRSEHHQPMETSEITEENHSAMEVSEITNRMEYNEAYQKGLPSSDEEMV